MNAWPSTDVPEGGLATVDFKLIGELHKPVCPLFCEVNQIIVQSERPVVVDDVEPDGRPVGVRRRSVPVGAQCEPDRARHGGVSWASDRLARVRRKVGTILAVPKETQHVFGRKREMKAREQADEDPPVGRVTTACRVVAQLLRRLRSGWSQRKGAAAAAPLAAGRARRIRRIRRTLPLGECLPAASPAVSPSGSACAVRARSKTVPPTPHLPLDASETGL